MFDPNLVQNVKFYRYGGSTKRQALDSHVTRRAVGVAGTVGIEHWEASQRSHIYNGLFGCACFGWAGASQRWFRCRPPSPAERDVNGAASVLTRPRPNRPERKGTATSRRKLAPIPHSPWRWSSSAMAPPRDSP